MIKRLLLIALLLQLPMTLLADDQDRPKMSISFIMANDNPFLNLLGDEDSPSLLYTEDDHGMTHGISVAASYLKSEGLFFDKQERWSVKYDSKLYTKDLTPAGQWDDYFPNNPQNFNEVTTVKISVDNLLAKKKAYYVAGVGMGIVNDSDDSGWNAAGQQQRWHDYKHNNLTPETTSTYLNEYGNTNDYFVSIKGAVGKIITFSDKMKDCDCEVNQIKIETGAEYISIKKGSNVYFLVEVDRSIIHFKKSSINLYGEVSGIAYESGDEELLYGAGISYKARHFTISTGWTFREGDTNDEFYMYTDDDAIWSLTLDFKF